MSFLRRLHAFHIKLLLSSGVLLFGFQSSPGTLKSAEAVPGKFHESGGDSKHKCLQDRANFHRPRSLQIVLMFFTLDPYDVHRVTQG